MKRKFVHTLVEFIEEMGVSLFDAFRRESMTKKFLRMGGHNPDKIFKGFQNLEYRQLMKQNNSGYVFTKKGRSWFNDNRFKLLRIKNQKWDGKWQVVIFDIPEELKKKRNIFRSKLKTLNFYMLQKSVFVCPFPCYKELNFLTGYLGINDYVDLIVADSVGPRVNDLKKIFELK